MTNSIRLPLLAIIAAILCGMAATFSYLYGDAPEIFHLTELEIGLIAWSIGLAIYGVQGFVSWISEGEQLELGRRLPRLTDTLSGMIVLFSIVLLLLAVLLVFGLVGDFSTLFIGLVAGLGCFSLGFLLVFYKEAFLGEEAQLNDRNDGIPW